MSAAQGSFGESNLPALHHAAGELSARAQREHLRGNQWLLALLLAGAIISVLRPAAEALSSLPLLENADHSPLVWLQDETVRQVLALIAAGAFFVGLLLTKSLQADKKADTWYDARAVAESAKSMAWKYMMRAGPYDSSLDTTAVDTLFCDDLAKLLTDIRGQLLPGASPAAGGQITPQMRTLRASSAAERLAVYVPARLDDQQAWYARRSGEHAAAAQRWYRASFALNATAMILALVAVIWAPANDFLSVVATAASCAIAWTQLRRYTDLAHSYSFTSHEIDLLKPRAAGVTTDDALARFVADCETAFSREHTMWRARRENADG